MKFRRHEATAVRAGARRDSLLSAVAVRNTLARERSVGDALRLSAPVKESGLSRIFGGRAMEKTFELDGLGMWVWGRIDGVRTVEALIREFAAEQRVNLREAEVAVTAFLKMLVKRGLVALSAPGGGGGAK